MFFVDFGQGLIYSYFHEISTKQKIPSWWSICIIYHITDVLYMYYICIIYHRCIINCHQSFSCHFIFPKSFKRWPFQDHLSNASLEYFYVVRKKLVNLLVYLSFDETFSTVRHVKVYLNVPLHVILHLLGIFLDPILW